MKIGNKCLTSFLFNTLDTPIRFIYTQLGEISKTLNSLFFWRLYTSNFQKLDNQFKEFLKILHKNHISISGKVILEIGPGNSYINAYNFLMNGAKKVILVDKFPRHFKSKNQRKFQQKELNFIKNKYPKKYLFFLSKDGNLKKDYIKFINKDLVKINNLSVDLIYSISVLEHVKDVIGNIKKMTEILQPKGYMYHKIDLRDHYNFNNPFLFYKYSDYVWNNYLTKEGLSYTNRWRYNDFINEFKKNNLKIIKQKFIRLTINKKLKIDKKFNKYGNLDIGIMNILLQKR
jgi:hypothetical protein